VWVVVGVEEVSRHVHIWGAERQRDTYRQRWVGCGRGEVRRHVHIK